MIGCVYGIYLWVMIRMLPFGPQLRWNITIHKVPHSAITIHSCSRTLPKPGADVGEIDHEKAEKASVGDARLTEVMPHPRPDGQVVSNFGGGSGELAISGMALRLPRFVRIRRVA